jgi:hypothetical protein
VAIEFLPGGGAFYASDSPTTSFSVVFEDDGQTGYAYAYDRDAPESARILDACHLYNAANVVDGDRHSRVEIIWRADGLKAAVLINDYAHAVLDFGARCAYCRTNFPPPGGAWRAAVRTPWDESMLADFSAPET